MNGVLYKEDGHQKNISWYKLTSRKSFLQRRPPPECLVYKEGPFQKVFSVKRQSLDGLLCKGYELQKVLSVKKARSSGDFNIKEPTSCRSCLHRRPLSDGVRSKEGDLQKVFPEQKHSKSYSQYRKPSYDTICIEHIQEIIFIKEKETPENILCTAELQTASRRSFRYRRPLEAILYTEDLWKFPYTEDLKKNFFSVQKLTPQKKEIRRITSELLILFNKIKILALSTPCTYKNVINYF